MALQPETCRGQPNDVQLDLHWHTEQAGKVGDSFAGNSCQPLYSPFQSRMPIDFLFQLKGVQYSKKRYRFPAKASTSNSIEPQLVSVAQPPETWRPYIGKPSVTCTQTPFSTAHLFI
jgi:hypothetical protein